MGRFARGRYFGPLSVLVAFFGIAGSIAASSEFAWTGSALSDLGVEGGVPTLLFNYGLVAAAVLALPFVAWYARGARERDDGRWRAAAAVALLAAVLGLGGVGLFPSGTTPHFPAAFLVYAGATFTFACHGTSAAFAGATRRGVAWLWVAVLHLFAWLLWILSRLFDAPLGLAVPETVGALLFAAWVVAVTRRA